MDLETVTSKPLTKEETKVLLSFIEKSNVINNKTTNATTNKMKTEEWKRVAEKFNAIIKSSHRTPQQLRLKWENLKKNARRRNTVIAMNNIKTGDDALSNIPPDDILDRVTALLSKTVNVSLDSVGEELGEKKETTEVLTSRASGIKRKKNSDENRSAKNAAIAKYYNIKAKTLEVSLDNIILENEKLKLEIETLKNKDY